MTKYYTGYVVPKSHSDYPCCPREVHFTASSPEEYEEEFRAATKGCEDYDIREVNDNSYKRIVGA